MNEKKDLYIMYCQIASSLYNFAFSNELKMKKQFTWAITANYYALVHAARFLCYLSLKKYPWGHPELRVLFSGKNQLGKDDSGVRSWSLKESSNKGVSQEKYYFKKLKEELAIFNFGEDKIRKLGKYLENVSKLRNDASYQKFIIANQVSHKYLNPLMERALQIDSYYKKLSVDILNSFLEYAKQHKYFVEFLNDSTDTTNKWAFRDLFLQLEEQNFSDDSQKMIKNIIKENIYDKSGNLDKVPGDFYPHISFAYFHEKKELMEEFEKHLKAIENIEIDYNDKKTNF